MVVALVCHTYTFLFALSKLVFICFIYILHLQKSYHIILDLLFQYIMPDRKIVILAKVREALTAKFSAKYIYWIMRLKFLKNILKGNISVKLQVAGLLQGWRHLGYFSKTMSANQQPPLWNTYFQVSLF